MSEQEQVQHRALPHMDSQNLQFARISALNAAAASNRGLGMSAIALIRQADMFTNFIVHGLDTNQPDQIG